jgi:hypothetical protein
MCWESRRRGDAVSSMVTEAAFCYFLTSIFPLVNITRIEYPATIRPREACQLSRAAASSADRSILIIPIMASMALG